MTLSYLLIALTCSLVTVTNGELLQDDPVEDLPFPHIVILGAIIGLLSPAYGTLSASADVDEDIHLYQAPWCCLRGVAEGLGSLGWACRVGFFREGGIPRRLGTEWRTRSRPSHCPLLGLGPDTGPRSLAVCLVQHHHHQPCRSDRQPSKGPAPWP